MGNIPCYFNSQWKSLDVYMYMQHIAIRADDDVTKNNMAEFLRRVWS